jgi:hypothetical protein
MPRLDLIAFGIREGIKRSLVSTATTVIRREIRDAARGEADKGKWASRWYDALRPILDVIMRSAVEREAAELGPFDPAGFLHEYTSELSRTLSETSYKKYRVTLLEALNDGLSVPETSRLMRERLPELNRGRAELIAVTELHTASEGANYRQAQMSGAVSRSVWHHSGKHDYRPEHKILDGHSRPLGTPYPTGELFPSKPRCGCFLTFDNEDVPEADRLAAVEAQRALERAAEDVPEGDVPEAAPDAVAGNLAPLSDDRERAVDHMFDERLDDDDPFADDPFAEPEGETEQEREQRLYEETVLREMQDQERSRLYEVIQSLGGIKTRDDLREEYRNIPNTFKRRDGLAGDDMAQHLAENYPEFGIESEYDLLEFFADRYGP